MYITEVCTKEKNMNLQDLSVLLAAVELAVKRGTFSILEIGVVGETASKLNAFLAEAKRQQDEAAAAAQAEQAAAEGQAPAEPQPEQPAQ
jgi:hypothetical protein